MRQTIIFQCSAHILTIVIFFLRFPAGEHGKIYSSFVVVVVVVMIMIMF